MTSWKLKANTNSFEETVSNYRKPDLGARHQVLADLYEKDPKEAIVQDVGETSSEFVPGSTHLYSQVQAGSYGLPRISLGSHEKIGGNGEFPNPGELLCASIAACFDSCVRLISCRLGVELQHLAVKAVAEVDVRGTLKMKADVPVAFQTISLDVSITAHPEVPVITLEAILKAAEESCIVMQTIKSAPEISITSHIGTPANESLV